MSDPSSMPAFGSAIATLIFVAQAAAADNLPVELFTTRDRQIAESESGRLRGYTLQVYQLDALEELEAALSRELPPEPENARAEVLRRVARLDRSQLATERLAAGGLAQAVEYGIDRLPAIVINGEAVVYGLTDINDALRRYGEWREEQAK